MSQCIQRSLWSLGLYGSLWSLWEVIARACLARCSYVSSSGHYLQLLPWSLWITTLDESLPWLSFFSLLAHSSFVDHCFVHLFCQFNAQPLPPVAGIFSGPPTKLWCHQSPSWSIGDELKLSYSLIWLISGEVCENWLRFLGSMCQFVLLLYGRLIFDIQFLFQAWVLQVLYVEKSWLTVP